jgi:hypothetical protein
LQFSKYARQLSKAFLGKPKILFIGQATIIKRGCEISMNSNLLQDIETLRGFLMKKAKEANDLNDEQVIKYSVKLDQLLIKAQYASIKN